MSANTFIELNDTPSNYVNSANKFVRVNSSSDGIQFWFVKLTDLDDVQATGSYTPQGGQGLVYSAAAGKWRPGTLDVYSAGNGLSKTALTLNVIAGAGGGLVANTSGVFISDIADVSGSYGSDTEIPVINVNSKGQITSVNTVQANVQTAYALAANYIGTLTGTAGQITVTGSGINANATLNLVATGVTSGVYGNTTHLPRITVDTYGRIQNVDLVQITSSGSGDGGTSLGFANIVVSGQTTIAADRIEDTLTLVAGAGISITTQANTDTIIFSANSSTLASSIKLSDLSDLDIDDIANGQGIVWNSAENKFQPADLGGGGVGTITGITAGVGLTGGGNTGNVTLALSNTAVAPGTYGSSSLIPRITVDQQGRVTAVTTQAVSGGGGGGGASVQRFKINYAANGDLLSATNLTAGITSVVVEAGGDVTITFSSNFFYPPASIMMYGYNHTSNKYLISHLETTMGLREMAGGGIPGDPISLDGSNQQIIRLRLREVETGASRGFGTTTHAWIQFVMFD
jgi:hypothetical protein